jgi:hypothetical protein
VELLEHPPYRLDFYKFGPLDGAIRRVHGSEEEEIKNALHAWLHTQATYFFQHNHKVG